MINSRLLNLDFLSKQAGVFSVYLHNLSFLFFHCKCGNFKIKEGNSLGAYKTEICLRLSDLCKVTGRREG